MRNTAPPISGSTGSRDMFANIRVDSDQILQEEREPEHVRRARATPQGQLRHDEQMLQLRLQRIRDFGSTWLRPAGRAKTLQAERDELAERLEAERLQALEIQNGGGEGLIAEGDEDDPGAAVRVIGNIMQVNEDSEVAPPGEVNLDEEIPEGISFEGDEEDSISIEDDLDDEIPSAEASYVSSDEDLESESSLVSENEYMNSRFRTPESRRIRAPHSSSSIGHHTDPESHLIAFSNDDPVEADVSFRTHVQRGARSRGLPVAPVDVEEDEDHEMEVDSDDD